MANEGIATIGGNKMNLTDMANEFFNLNIEDEGNLDLESDLTSLDIDDDGIYETTALGFDSDGDGQLDSLIIQSDFNSDGITDQTSFIEALDTDGDEQIDTLVVQTDLDGDLITDDMALVTDTDEDGFPDTLLAEQTAIDNTNIIGNPISDIENWHMQTYDDTCAIASQEFILDEMTGQDFSEDELRQEAIEMGWYTPGGGTPLDCMGNLLEAHGINVDKQYGCTLDDLSQKLASGENVIIALDADEIWNPNDIDTDDILANVAGLPEQGVNHAVQVIGVDYSDRDNPVIILNDPGQPDGQGIIVNADEFVDAWEDSNNYMVSTNKNLPHSQETSQAHVGALDSWGRTYYESSGEYYSTFE